MKAIAEIQEQAIQKMEEELKTATDPDQIRSLAVSIKRIAERKELMAIRKNMKAKRAAAKVAK